MTTAVVETSSSFEKRLGSIKIRNASTGFQLDVLEKESSKKSKILSVKEAELEKFEKIRNVLEDATTTSRTKGKELLEIGTTTMLQAIIGSSYRISINIGSSVLSPEVDVKLMQTIDGTEGEVPILSGAGGITDIVAQCLFIQVKVLFGNKNTAPLLMDESTKYVSAEFREKNADAFKEFVTITDNQIITVTHDQKIKNIADKYFGFFLNDNQISEIGVQMKDGIITSMSDDFKRYLDSAKDEKIEKSIEDLSSSFKEELEGMTPIGPVDEDFYEEKRKFFLSSLKEFKKYQKKHWNKRSFESDEDYYKRLLEEL